MTALVERDAVYDLSTTTGTGTFTVLNQPPTGYRTFDNVLSINDGCAIRIRNTALNEWEDSIAVYTGTHQLTRVLVLASSNAGSPVNFSVGSKEVYLTKLAETMPRVLNFYGTTAPSTVKLGAAIETILTDPTSGSEDFDLRFSQMINGAPASEVFRISGGNLVVGTAALATNATAGFPYVPTCAGAPVGTPATFTGRAPFIWDATNNTLNFYSSGVWHSVSGMGSGLVTGGTTVRANADRWIDPWVNVKEFGAVGDNSHDDTAAIQAAIDYAYANHIKTIFIPAGNYKITSPIYLDPPGNLRVSFTSPSIFNFSLSLIGAEGLGNHEGWGTNIRPTFANNIGLIVGTGQGMLVKNINMLGLNSAYRQMQDPAGVGIGLTGGSAGSSSNRIENCFVEGFYAGFKTGANGDSLCDSNTFIKCEAVNTYIGFWVAQTQNFINSFYDCFIAETGRALVSNVGGGAHVYGGNWSATGAQANAFNISSVGSFAWDGFQMTFNATIASPDQYIFTVYTVYCFVTAHFGIVPCFMQSFNTGTNVATFVVDGQWIAYYYPNTDPTTYTDLPAEITALTKMYAAEVVTAFEGADITVVGAHIENPNGVTRFFNSTVGFGDNRPNYVNGVHFNADPSFQQFRPQNSPSDHELSLYYAAQVTAFLRIDNVSLYFSDSHVNSLRSVIVDFTANGGENARLWVDRQTDFYVNIRCITGQFFGGAFDQEGSTYSNPLGGGEWDSCDMWVPFNARAAGFLNVSGDHLAERYRGNGWGKTKYWGYRPAHNTTPVVRNDAVAYAGALPAMTLGNCPYAILYGGQRYGVYDYYTGVHANYNLISNHHSYSYGQDITTTNCPGLSWTYKGKSFCVYMSDTSGSLGYIFPGLTIKLNDGTTDCLYVVTGLYPDLGYFTVVAWNGGGSPDRYLSGTKTSIVTGTVIKQEPYAITAF